MFSADIDTKRLTTLMAVWGKETKKGMDDVILEQSAMIVGHFIAMTPPAKAKGGSGPIGKEEKKLGENTIRADLNSLFPTTKLKSEEVWGMIENGFRWGTGRGAKKIGAYAESIADLERIHRNARSKRTGRVRTGTIGQNMALTKKSILKTFISKQIKEVGMLNAGWLRAAEELKTSKRQIPAWIRRHGKKPGDAQKTKTKSGLRVTVSNRMDYFPKNMKSRMQAAANRRERGLEKALEAMLARKANKLTRKLTKIF